MKLNANMLGNSDSEDDEIRKMANLNESTS